MQERKRFRMWGRVDDENGGEGRDEGGSRSWGGGKVKVEHPF